MAPDSSRRPLTSEQKRMLLLLIVLAGVVAMLSIAIGWLAVLLGLPHDLAVVIAVIVAAVVGLIVFLSVV
jgi:hypothetical protein